MNRHQFNRRHSQGLQVGNFVDHAQVGSGMRRSAVAASSEPSDMHLVDDRLTQFASQVPVALPIKMIVDNHAFGWTNDAIASGQKISGQGTSVGIDQPRGGIESVTFLRLKRAFSLQMVQLAIAQARHEHAPDISPAIVIGIHLDDFHWFQIRDPIVQQYPHRGRIAAEHDKLHAVGMQHRTVWQVMIELQVKLVVLHYFKQLIRLLVNTV